MRKLIKQYHGEPRSCGNDSGKTKFTPSIQAKYTCPEKRHLKQRETTLRDLAKL